LLNRGKPVGEAIKVNIEAGIKADTKAGIEARKTVGTEIIVGEEFPKEKEIACNVNAKEFTIHAADITGTVL
jgi:hypothetical protein